MARSIERVRDAFPVPGDNSEYRARNYYAQRAWSTFTFMPLASTKNQWRRPRFLPLAALHGSGVLRPKPRRDLSTAIHWPPGGGPILAVAKLSTCRAVIAAGAHMEYVNPPSAENTRAGVWSSKSSGCSVTVTLRSNHLCRFEPSAADAASIPVFKVSALSGFGMQRSLPLVLRRSRRRS